MANPRRLRNSFIEIHLDRIQSNLKLLKSCLRPHEFFCPMVKADAYGHGDIEVARIVEAEGVEGMGVVTVEEGMRLRTAGIQAPILVFGLFDSASAEETIRFDLAPVVSTWEHIDHLSKHLTDQQKYPVHLKFNTGMNRLGFDISECTRLVDYFKNQSQMRVQGICTHFSRSDDANDAMGSSRKQIQKFLAVESAFAIFQPRVHLSNSGGLLVRAAPEASGVLSSLSGLGARPGLAVYGVSPLSPSTSVSFSIPGKLRPAMEVKSVLGLIRKVSKGESVSYGPRWTAERESLIGIIPIGYADGYPRLLSNRGSMIVKGHRVPVVGSICMDYTMVDLTDLVLDGEVPIVGDEVCVLGEDGDALVSSEDIADICGTIPYEILTGFSARLPRVFMGIA